ncbi:MAG: YlxM family DNA-binding protein [Eubacteriales bacterium]
MDTNVKINWLLDFYGAMLTERQRSAMEMHYGDDLSLSEISETLNITRQAVHDSLKRGEKTLINYEEKLGLLKRYFDIGSRIKNLKDKAEVLYNSDIYKDIYDEIIDLMEKWEY